MRITPASFVRLRRLLIDTGWRVIVAVDFGHYDSARADDEARHAAHILSRYLVGIEIGNEPNDYNLGAIDLRLGYYTFADYESQIDAYAHAIKAVVPRTALVGPDTTSAAWLGAIAGEHLPFNMLTEHLNPLSFRFSKASSV